MNVLVTGAAGFLGRNLCVMLKRRAGLQVEEFDKGSTRAELERMLSSADFVFHLAGVNRPQRVEEFEEGNVDFTAAVLGHLKTLGRRVPVVLSSSIQATRDNPYGISKRGAEEELRRYCEETGAEGVVFRLKNLFGKWSRPNYNSVVATFCNAIANGEPYSISDPEARLDLCYVDDVVAAFLEELDEVRRPGLRAGREVPSHTVTLGALEAQLLSFRDQRTNLTLPDFSTPFARALYATYLSYLRPQVFRYGLTKRSDDRGSLAEFVKSPQFGQIFVSRTRPGITRGNHYHHTKVEKFMVVQGVAVIRLRQVHGEEVTEFVCRGEDYQVVDIPPGFTHSIENQGTTDLVTLFWADEQFDPGRPDTYFDPVLPAKQ